MNLKDQQYLKAMNIDVWVERDVDDSALSGVQTAVAQKSDVSQTPVAERAAIAELSASELVQALRGFNVAGDLSSKADLLVVTESEELTRECHELLDSMLKAIKLAKSQWLHVGMDPHGAPIESVLKTKRAVLIMAKSGGALNGLDALRGIQHSIHNGAAFAMVTFHPQDLLDNADAKRPAWEDLKLLRQRLA